MTVQECGSETEAQAAQRENWTCAWQAGRWHKGLAVLARAPYAVQEREPSHPFAVSTLISGPVSFRFVGFWAMTEKDIGLTYTRQATQVIEGLPEDGIPTVLAGDFNASKSAAHLRNVQRLASRGLKSAYHSHHGVEHRSTERASDVLPHVAARETLPYGFGVRPERVANRCSRGWALRGLLVSWWVERPCSYRCHDRGFQMTEGSGTGISKPGRGYYVLLTDGSMENSGRRVNTDPPGAAGIGAVLKDSNDRVVDTLSRAIGPATKDEAEYRALIEGLQLAKGFGVTRIRVYMDAEYIVDQMNERAGANNPVTRGLFEKARVLLREFPDHRVSWIPREWNKDADRLALEGRQPDSDLEQN